jgi:hypothetical protein
MDKYLKHFSKQAVILIALGTIVWSATMVKSGLCWDAKCASGLGFWGPNGHDGVWHISLIESLANGSWKMPVFAGEVIKNYHIGYDLIVSWLHKLTFIPISTLYFQIIPPFLALTIGIIVYKFVESWRKSKLQAFWATFFVYFGGGFGWLITYFRNGELGGESMFWSQQSISTLINPPFALSILVIFIALYLLLQASKSNNKSKKKKIMMITTFLFGVLIQIKVYAGILALGGLFVAGFWRMFKRQGIDMMKVFTGALIISLLLYLPMSKGTSSIILFSPFWFLETMMGFTDRFYWPKFAEAMVNYKLAGSLIKGIAAYVIAFIIFVIGNFGTRLVKDIWIIKKIKDFKNLYFMDVFFFSLIAAGIIIPMFYIQRGTAWNTIQFMYYSLMFSGILAGIWLGDFMEKNKAKATSYLLPATIIILTIPTTIGTLKHYLPSRPPAKISKEELEALKFLSTQPDGVVLTYPFDREAADAAVDNPPRPLYLYESTAYVSAFSKKPVYIEDEVNLEITGYEWRGRRDKVMQFINAKDKDMARNFLDESNISYVYLARGMKTVLSKDELGIEDIFENSDVKIYKVN